MNSHGVFASQIDNDRTVTAVLVCWNHELFVEQAVMSALRQTHKDLQLIVIDNGSTDRSRDVLEALQRSYSFTLLLQENIGLVRALNRGLELARGAYFAVLATDDRWVETKLDSQVTFLEQHADYHLVSGQIRHIDELGNNIDSPIFAQPGEVTFAQLMTLGNRVFGPTIMCRTATLKKLGGYDESIRLEDYSIALAMTKANYRVMVLDEILTLYRRHANNWTAKSIASELQELGNKYRNCSEYKAYYRHHFFRPVKDLVDRGRRVEALQLMMREPVAWTWDDVGVGLIKMIVPRSLIRIARSVFR